MDLKQVEAGNAPVLTQCRDLSRAAGARGGPDLVGCEQSRRPAVLSDAVADGGLRQPVDGRGVDQAAACLEEGTHHRRAGVAGNGIIVKVEGDPSAKPDDGATPSQSRGLAGSGAALVAPRRPKRGETWPRYQPHQRSPTACGAQRMGILASRDGRSCAKADLT
jgi:hypothetical protein